MATFRTLSPALWSDPFIEDLSAQEKLLYIYLFTNEHVNNVGVMQVSLRKISFETAVPQEVVGAFLEKTGALGKTVRDGDALLCLNFVRYQTTKSPQVTKNLRKVFAMVTSSKLRQALMERYPDIFKGRDSEEEPSPKDSDTPPIPYREGSETASQSLSDHGYTPCRQRQGIAGHSRVKKEKDTPPLPPSPGGGACEAHASAPLSGEELENARDAVQAERRRGDYEFGVLRSEYDKARQEGPMAGRQEFLQLFASQDFPGLDEMLAGLRRLLEQDDQFRRGYAPGLSRFLRERMWTMRPRAPAGQEREPERTPEELEAERKIAEMRARRKAREAERRQGKTWTSTFSTAL